jgi:1-acyl-sn-glycerol-3-phosphate acyltransferase
MSRFKSVLISIYLWTAVGLLVLFWLFITTPMYLITAPLDPGRRLLHRWGLLLGRTIVRINPLWTLHIEGVERVPEGRPFVYVANHESHGDTVSLCAIRRQFKWVQKESLAKIPVFGWQTQMAGYIAVRRGDRESARRAMERAARYLALGVGVFFFAEGTRSQTGEVGRFKEGAFRLALETNTPIVPIAITGTRDALPKHSLLFTSRAFVRIWVGAPIPVEGPYTPEAAERLAEEARGIIIAEKAKLDAMPWPGAGSGPRV